MKMKEVLYVPNLKKNLLSISALDKKGYRVAFIDGQVLMWTKENQLKMQLSLVKKEDYINSKDIRKQPLSTRSLAQVNYGIEWLLTSNTKHYPM